MKKHEITIEMKILHFPSKLAKSRVKKAICDSCREVGESFDIVSLDSQLKKSIVQQSTETLIFIMDDRDVASISGKHNGDSFEITALYISESYFYMAILEAICEFTKEIYGCVSVVPRSGTIDDDSNCIPGRFYSFTD